MGIIYVIYYGFGDAIVNSIKFWYGFHNFVQCGLESSPDKLD
jgi:hypothetical protein